MPPCIASSARMSSFENQLLVTNRESAANSAKGRIGTQPAFQLCGSRRFVQPWCHAAESDPLRILQCRLRQVSPLHHAKLFEGTPTTPRSRYRSVQSDDRAKLRGPQTTSLLPPRNSTPADADSR